MRQTNLDKFVPASRNDDRVGVGGRESDARHPIGVNLLLDRVFADAESIPQFDSAIARSGHDLPDGKRRRSRFSI